MIGIIAHGRQQHKSAYSPCFRLSSLSYGFPGRTFCYIEYNRNLSTYVTDGRLHQRSFFFESKGAGFPKCSAQDYAIDSGIELYIKILQKQLNIKGILCSKFGG